MSLNIKNREVVLATLQEELVGPSPQGKEVDCTGEVRFTSAGEFYRPYRQSGTGEEILQRDPPCKRYGVGVLYPQGIVMEDVGSGTPGANAADLTDALGEDTAADLTEALGEDTAAEKDARPTETDQLVIDRSSRGGEAESDDLDISSANRYRPSSMGVSFLLELAPGARLEVEATGGRYESKEVAYGTDERTHRVWWLRKSVDIKAVYAEEALRVDESSKVNSLGVELSGNGPIDLRIEVFARPQRDTNHKLVTVCLVNRSDQSSRANECSLFQCHLLARVVSKDSCCHILPYPGVPHERMDDEEQSLALLYRDYETFAVGHGCAADWSRPESSQKAECVIAKCLPRVEVPSIAADVRRPDGRELKISMKSLAGLDGDNDDFSAMKELIDYYESWIEDQKNAVGTLDAKHQPAARKNMDLCARCVDRMKRGLSYLLADDQARTAFQLANHAILLQQIRGSREARSVSYDSSNKKLAFYEQYQDVELDQIPDDKGNWRAFQIAFLLASVRSAADGRDSDRDTVELIWFPTGGGKTEAYLGLAAFSMFMRRLKDPRDTGVHVIMRYTLRLLTAQQFQRASALICAMEYLRHGRKEELGDCPFSIGVWLGSDNTPNLRSEARKALQSLVRLGSRAQNPFVITKCPWCNAEMGPVRAKMPKNLRVLGYERSGETVVLCCPDPKCCFSSSLPINVIDEDIYENRPSLIIGTVDKFAMLAWRSEPRSLFGLDANGSRFCSPPGLIIQDELHLISGPLGSMVGLYEMVLEELCTDKRDGTVRPKIVSSTATIRRYAEQIRCLFGRNEVALFPPPGLTVGDSFFSGYARDMVSGTLLPGKVYVGVHAPGLGSMQTLQVRAFSALLQSPMALPEPERDPWWTLLLFFNSLRELGTTLSLFQSDIPDYSGVIQNRLGLDWSVMRQVRRELELTSRLRNDEVPRAIEELEKAYGTRGGGPIDTCLSSSIIEVGIDIDRLSLMSVVGQPKSTSQYIQVTGRVGRKWKDRPGLVVTLYGASKPRDRSHFEQFRSYHERLYSQVEPTSVTPFSRPALERALHGVMVSYVRQQGNLRVTERPYPAPDQLLGDFEKLLEDRVATVDTNETAIAKQVFEKRRRQWKKWHRTEWRGSPSSENAPLLVMAGSYVPQTWRYLTWETPTSMRNVDVECGIAITKLYLQDGVEDQ